MNRYDETHIFRTATIKDVDAIMQFIKMYWGENHILAQDKEFLLYEYGNGEQLNFNLAIDKKTGQIDVIMGFYLYSKDKNGCDSSGGLLRVNPNCRIPFIGMEVVKRHIANIGRVYIGNGANPNTALPLEKRILGHSVGKLKQFYRINPKENFKIAIIKNKKIKTITEPIQKGLYRVHSVEEMYIVFDDENFKNRITYKDRGYIEKRYFEHPIYHYRLYSIGKESVKTILVLREISHDGGKIARIVDVLGDEKELAYVGDAIQKMLEENEYEYIDIYEHGVEDTVMARAGFTQREEDDENIIPNYFEPYVAKNIDIYYHTACENAKIFKADGDQDRPNYRK